MSHPGLSEWFIVEVSDDDTTVLPPTSAREMAQRRRAGAGWCRWAYRGPDSSLGYAARAPAVARAVELLNAYDTRLAVGRRARPTASGRWRFSAVEVVAHRRCPHCGAATTAAADAGADDDDDARRAPLIGRAAHHLQVARHGVENASSPGTGPAAPGGGDDG